LGLDQILTSFSSTAERSLDGTNVRTTQCVEFCMHRAKQHLAMLTQSRCRRNRLNEYPLGWAWLRAQRRLWVVPTTMRFGRQPCRTIAQFF